MIELIEKGITCLDVAGIDHKYLDRKFGVRKEQIREVERLLDKRFPESYRWFLHEYGSGDFLGIEILGLIQDQIYVEEIPNGYWLSCEMRAKDDLPSDLFVIQELGGSTFACIKLQDSEVDYESPVYCWDFSTPSTTTDLLAESFGDYFLTLVESVLAEHKGKWDRK